MKEITFIPSKRRLLKAMASMVAGATASHIIPLNASSQTRGGHLRVWLDDYGTVLTQTTVARRCWGETLTEATADGGKVLPLLAEQWSSRQGGLLWVFKLRKRVRYHNGRLLQARDVVASIMRLPAWQRTQCLPELREVKAEGSHSVSLHFRRPMAEVPLMLTDAALVIRPADAADDAWIGTGPYVCREVEPEAVLLKRFQEGGQYDSGFVDSIELRYVSDTTKRLSGILDGRADLVDGVTTAAVPLLQSSKIAKVQQILGRQHIAWVLGAEQRHHGHWLQPLLAQVPLADILQGVAGAGLPVLSTTKKPPSIAGVLPPQHLPDLHISSAVHPQALKAAQAIQQHIAKAGLNFAIKEHAGPHYWRSVWQWAPWYASYSSGRRSVAQSLYQLLPLVAEGSDFRTQVHKIAAISSPKSQVAALTELREKTIDDLGWMSPTFFHHRDASTTWVHGGGTASTS